MNELVRRLRYVLLACDRGGSNHLLYHYGSAKTAELLTFFY